MVWSPSSQLLLSCFPATNDTVKVAADRAPHIRHPRSCHTRSWHRPPSISGKPSRQSVPSQVPFHRLLSLSLNHALCSSHRAPHACHSDSQRCPRFPTRTRRPHSLYFSLPSSQLSELPRSEPGQGIRSTCRDRLRQARSCRHLNI